jgi:hypothetical protein
MAQETQNAVTRHAQADMANVPAASHDAPKAATRKLGEGHAMAMLRLGGHELTQALAAFPDSNVRPMDEPGAVGNATPQIVTQQMGMSYVDMLDQAASRARDGDERGRTR